MIKKIYLPGPGLTMVKIKKVYLPGTGTNHDQEGRWANHDQKGILTCITNNEMCVMLDCPRGFINF